MADSDEKPRHLEHWSDEEIAKWEAGLPDLKYLGQGAQLEIRHNIELLEKEWRLRVGTTFPGFTRESLWAIASWAGLSREAAGQMTGGEICVYAMSKLGSPVRPSQENEDGPDADRPEAFYWANRLHRIGKANWQLCCAIWNQRGVSFAEIGQAVWGDDCTSSSTIKSRLSRLNEKLKELEIPLQWIVRSERIYLDDGSDDPVAD